MLSRLAMHSLRLLLRLRPSKLNGLVDDANGEGPRTLATSRDRCRSCARCRTHSAA